MIASKKTKTFFLIFSAIALIAVFLHLILENWEIILSSLKNGKYEYLLLAFLVYTLNLPLTVYVWHLITRELGLEIPWRKTLFVFCLSALGKRLPGTLWYIAWRNELYAEEGKGGRFQIVASSLEQLSIALAAILLSSLFSFGIISRMPQALFAYLFILFLLVLFFVPSIQRRIFSKMGITEYHLRFNKLLIWALYYIPVWILNGVLLFFISNIFSPISWVSIPYFIGAVCLTGVISRVLIILPSNFGVGELSLMLLLAGIIPVSIGAVIAVANRIIMIAFELIWAGLVIVLFGKEFKKVNTV